MSWTRACLAPALTQPRQRRSLRGGPLRGMAAVVWAQLPALERSALSCLLTRTGAQDEDRSLSCTETLYRTVTRDLGSTGTRQVSRGHLLPQE